MNTMRSAEDHLRKTITGCINITHFYCVTQRRRSSLSSRPNPSRQRKRKILNGSRDDDHASKTVKTWQSSFILPLFCAWKKCGKAALQLTLLLSFEFSRARVLTTWFCCVNNRCQQRSLTLDGVCWEVWIFFFIFVAKLFPCTVKLIHSAKLASCLPSFQKITGRRQRLQINQGNNFACTNSGNCQLVCVYAQKM